MMAQLAAHHHGSPGSEALPAGLARNKAGQRVRVLLIISSLEHGGAERQVVQLANHLDASCFDVQVCSLSSEVPLAETLNDHGRLHIVDKRWRYDFTTVSRVARLMRELGTDLVHAFLFDAEIVARLAARRAGVRAVVASERNTDYHMSVVHRIGQRLTRSMYHALIANSQSGKNFVMRTLGLADDKVHVVRNGVDVERFYQREAAAARARLGLPESGPVVGMVATFKRQKNHHHFLRMARAIIDQQPQARFVCVGQAMRDNQQGAQDYYDEMQRLVDQLDLRDHCLFAGNRNDLPEVYNAFDVVVLPSSREGVPNVLLEAQACGVPVVATDVADNSIIVKDGHSGYVVPLDDVEALTERTVQLISDPVRRATFGRNARALVQSEFSVEKCTERTAAIYQHLVEVPKELT
jgi:glycosyltransferase involved in cell wall biosynthesis